MHLESNSWSIIAHGGVNSFKAAHEKELWKEGLRQVIAAGSKILDSGGSALDTVEAAVKILETNPSYNAGLYGSVKNEDGVINLDASIMDGKTLDIGAIAGLQNIEHPISVARALLAEKPIFLIGEGLEKFAEEKGFKKLPDADVYGKTAKTKKNIEKYNHNKKDGDTVGCVARDMHGNLAVATSTGGIKGVKAGRVGDVPLPGCGFYANNSRAAISASGVGELIARVTLAAQFLDFMKQTDPQKAINLALTSLNQVNGKAGLIVITATGEIFWGHNSGGFVVGYADSNHSDPKVYLRKSEE